MSFYIFHMNSLQSTVQPGALLYIQFTLLAHAPEQTCLPHLICMSSITNTILYIDPTLLHTSKK